jgi:hypothetical protein
MLYYMESIKGIMGIAELLILTLAGAAVAAAGFTGLVLLVEKVIKA